MLPRKNQLHAEYDLAQRASTFKAAQAKIQSLGDQMARAEAAAAAEADLAAATMNGLLTPEPASNVIIAGKTNFRPNDEFVLASANTGVPLV